MPNSPYVVWVSQFERTRFVPPLDLSGGTMSAMAAAVFNAVPDLERVRIVEIHDPDDWQCEIRTPGFVIPDQAQQQISIAVTIGMHATFSAAIE